MVLRWRWNHIFNYDFYGLFTFQGFQNRRDNGVWTEEDEETEAGLINAQTDQFKKGIVFWGVVSSQGL